MLALPDRRWRRASCPDCFVLFSPLVQRSSRQSHGDDEIRRSSDCLQCGEMASLPLNDGAALAHTVSRGQNGNKPPVLCTTRNKRQQNHALLSHNKMEAIQCIDADFTVLNYLPRVLISLIILILYIYCRTFYKTISIQRYSRALTLSIINRSPFDTVSSSRPVIIVGTL